MKLALDLLGGDTPPKELIPLAVEILAETPKSLRLILIGTSDLQALLPKLDRLEFLEAENAISQADDPLFAVRKKRRSSMALGLSLLKEGRAQAFVTMGNTGALTAFCTLDLSLLPGFTRPALLAPIPLKNKVLVVGDVGANVDCSREQYVQFAKMGLQFQRTAYGVSSPKLGLLNIGEEESKGREVVRQAYQDLKALASDTSEDFQFVGNIEASQVFDSDIDVLVTGGFAGNIFLKTAEGVRRLFFEYLNEEEKAKLPFSRSAAAFMGGIESVVVKCHGDSTAEELKEGILLAIKLA